MLSIIILDPGTQHFNEPLFIDFSISPYKYGYLVIIWILLNSCGDRISLNIYKKMLGSLAFILSVLEVIQLQMWICVGPRG